MITDVRNATQCMTFYIRGKKLSQMLNVRNADLNDIQNSFPFPVSLQTELLLSYVIREHVGWIKHAAVKDARLAK
jgi:hypothetical protein